MTTIGSDDEVTAVSDSEDEATVSFEFDDEGVFSGGGAASSGSSIDGHVQNKFLSP